MRKRWECVFDVVVRVKAEDAADADKQALDAIRGIEGVLALRAKNMDTRLASDEPLAPGDL